MKKLKVYLDTSVISYLYQNDAPEKMADTLALWDLFEKEIYEIYISDVVLEEIYHCNEHKLNVLLDYLDRVKINVLKTDKNTMALAEKFIDFGILKKKSLDDCQHISAAILGGCDIITSWNFKHIVNIKTAKGVKVITTLEGYKDILIYPPSALLEGVEEDE